MANLLVILLVIIGTCFHWNAAEETSDVVVLTANNFAEQLAKGNWLLDFYAPWCGHCKQLAPTYEKVATQLKGRVNVGKIDCTVEKELGTIFKVEGFPTIKFVAADKVYQYDGDRTLESFVAFAEGEYSKGSSNPLPSLPSSPSALPNTVDTPASSGSDVVVLTDANFDKLTAQGDWLLDFYAPWCGHCKKLAPIYEQLATKLKGKVNVAKIDCTVESQIAKRFAIAGFPTLKFLKGGQIRDYQGDRSLDSFVEYVSSGWTKVDGAPVPDKSAGLQGEELKKLWNSTEKLLKDKLWIVIAAVFVLGMIVGKFVFSTAPTPVVGPHTD